MKLLFPGTSAGELYPGIWCRCRNCESARTGPPLNRRQSACLYVEAGDTRLMIDFPPEIAGQSLAHNIRLAELSQLLITHSHGDHWHPYQLRWRSPAAELVQPCETGRPQYGGARITPVRRLGIYGNPSVAAILRRELGDDLNAYEIDYQIVQAGNPFDAGEIRVLPVPANHDVGRESCVHYILRNGSRCVLYALDGDTFLDETRLVLREHQFDAVIMEATYGFGSGGNHRNFERLIEEADWLRAERILKPAGVIVATHFSPHHCPPHGECAEHLAKHDIIAAFDGMEMQI